jgi:hypothetical protein
MKGSMAENFMLFGYEDLGVSVILSPDVTLTLFLDGSAVYKSTRYQIIYPSCWDKQGERAFIPQSATN